MFIIMAGSTASALLVALMVINTRSHHSTRAQKMRDVTITEEGIVVSVHYYREEVLLFIA